MNFFRGAWRIIRRNPVLNAIVATVALQMAQDYLAGQIDMAHISGYLFTLVVGVIARSVVTPTREAISENARHFNAGAESARTRWGSND